MNKIKWLPLIMTLLLICCALMGCAAKDPKELADMPISALKPPKRPDKEQRGTYDARLYFLNEDGSRLVCEKREVKIEDNGCAAYAVINALLKGPENPAYNRSMPKRLKLEGVETSLDVCSVFFSGRFNSTEQEWLTARLAMAASLKDTLDINGVDVFYNGKAKSYKNLPLGQIKYEKQELGDYLEELARIYGVGETGLEADRHISQSLSLYYVDAGSELIVAQSGDITIDANMGAEQIISLICEKLITVPDNKYGLESALPADFSIVEQSLTIYDEGEQNENGAEQISLYAPIIAEIVIEKPLEYYDERFMCASLALSICTYVPNIEGIRVFVEEGMDMQTKLMPKYDYIAREDCTDLLGTNITVLYPDEKWQMLYPQDKILPIAEKDDMYMHLCALLGSDSADAPLAPLTKDDLNDVYLVGDVAVVDWKAGFSNKLRAAFEEDDADLARRQEMLTLYSVINTLGELPYVRSVWMSENGEKLGTIKNIYLGNALLRSPGIIRNN